MVRLQLKVYDSLHSGIAISPPSQRRRVPIRVVPLHSPLQSSPGIIEQASTVESVGCVELFPSAAAETIARARPETWQAGLRAAEISAVNIQETHAPFCSSQVVLFHNQFMADKR